MSRLSDAQYELVGAYVEEVAQARGLTDAQEEELSRAVFADGSLWDEDMWQPFVDFVESKLD